MLLSFLGTKGGTGTTTIAVNCAAEVHRLTGARTLIVDARQAPGDVAVFLGLRPRYSVVHLLDQMGWNDAALACRYLTEHASGVHVLAAAETYGRPNSRDAEGIEQALRCFAALYDYVLVDAGSSLTACAVVALQMSDAVTLVANPDVPCLRNLQRLADALRLAGVPSERVRVLLNRMSEYGALGVAQIEQVLGRAIEFQVASDYRTVAAAVTAGVPVSTLRPSELQLQLAAMTRTLLDAGKAA